MNTAPVSPDHTRRRRVAPLLLLPVLGGMIAGLLIGIHLSPSAGSPQPTRSLPSMGADFPTTADAYLPDLTVDLISVQWLQQQAQWRCEHRAAGVVDAPAKNDTTCFALRSNASVRIVYDQPAQIRFVWASCRYPPGEPACRTLFTALAELAAHQDPQLRAQAAGWATTNVDRDASTIIGQLRLITTLDPHRLAVYPLE